MAMKLPRVTVEELERLVEQLSKEDPTLRNAAMLRLEDYERAGRVPLEALLEFSESEHPPLSMYAISALGRNGEPGAVKKLIELVQRHQGGNVLFLETIVDALGETRKPAASEVLLALLGIRLKRGMLFGRRGRKNEEEDPQALRLRERLALPVIRALDRIEDPKAAELLGDFLGHEDPLVRWHTIQSLVKCNVATQRARIQELAAQDPNELVREAATLALERLEVLPPKFNN